MRYKWLILLLISVLLRAEEIEVRLKTTLDLKPIYLSKIATDPSQFDWRYFDELRAVLEFDFQTGGFAAVLPARDEWEQTFHWPEVTRDFDLAFWRREKVPFVIAIHVFKETMQATLFDIEKGTSKRSPSFLVSGRLETDRKQIHKMVDAIHKDLFGQEGIASLRLIYSQREGTPSGAWISEIWISDFDGMNAKQATFENNYCITPSFYPHNAGSPDPQFLFVSYKYGQSKIYRSSMGTKKMEPLIDLRGSQLLPALSAKGTQIAFIADAAGRPDLFLQNFDPSGRKLGKSRQLFSAPRATMASPTFSPDGRKIAFVSDKDGPPRIYVIEVTSSKETKRPHPHLVTKKNRENTCPAWSLDGKKLAYSAKVDGVRQIWIYDFETEEEIPLTSGPENKENPAWAPDSLHLVYNTDSNDEGQIYLINLRGRESTQITQGDGQKRFASWESR